MNFTEQCVLGIIPLLIGYLIGLVRRRAEKSSHDFEKVLLRFHDLAKQIEFVRTSLQGKFEQENKKIEEASHYFEKNFSEISRNLETFRTQMNDIQDTLFISSNKNQENWGRIMSLSDALKKQTLHFQSIQNEVESLKKA